MLVRRGGSPSSGRESRMSGRQLATLDAVSASMQENSLQAEQFRVRCQELVEELEGRDRLLRAKDDIIRSLRGGGTSGGSPAASGRLETSIALRGGCPHCDARVQHTRARLAERSLTPGPTGHGDDARTVAQLTSALADADAQAIEALRRLRRVEEENMRVRSELREASAAAARLQVELEGARDAEGRMRRELSEAAAARLAEQERWQHTSTNFEQMVLRLRDANDRLESGLSPRRANRSPSPTYRRGGGAVLPAEVARVEAFAQRVSGLVGLLEGAEASEGKLRRSLGDSADRCTALQEELDRLRGQRERTSRELEAVRTENMRHTAEIQGLQSELDSLRHQLAARSAAADGLALRAEEAERASGMLERDAERVRQQLEHEESQHRALRAQIATETRRRQKRAMENVLRRTVYGRRLVVWTILIRYVHAQRARRMHAQAASDARRYGEDAERMQLCLEEAREAQERVRAQLRAHLLQRQRAAVTALMSSTRKGKMMCAWLALSRWRDRQRAHGVLASADKLLGELDASRQKMAEARRRRRLAALQALMSTSTRGRRLAAWAALAWWRGLRQAERRAAQQAEQCARESEEAQRRAAERRRWQVARRALETLLGNRARHVRAHCWTRLLVHAARARPLPVAPDGRGRLAAGRAMDCLAAANQRLRRAVAWHRLRAHAVRRRTRGLLPTPVQDEERERARLGAAEVSARVQIMARASGRLGRMGTIGVELRQDPDGQLSVASVVSGGPAHRAGLQAGDVLLWVSGGRDGLTRRRPGAVRCPHAFRDALSPHNGVHAGSRVRLGFQRGGDDGEEHEVAVTLADTTDHVRPHLHRMLTQLRDTGEPAATFRGLQVDRVLAVLTEPSELWQQAQESFTSATANITPDAWRKGVTHLEQQLGCPGLHLRGELDRVYATCGAGRDSVSFAELFGALRDMLHRALRAADGQFAGSPARRRRGTLTGAPATQQQSAPLQLLTASLGTPPYGPLETPEAGDGECPRALQVTTPYACCNGLYTLQLGRKRDGRPVWQKTAGTPRYIFFSSARNEWLLSDELEDDGFVRAAAAPSPVRTIWRAGAGMNMKKAQVIAAH
eukprot:TRINITY_DN20460_c0_g1_i1.p1 TRINITY_DN20460_c0_g1~~TRINITY_DN20460_c0_g1_i1.p1  ORF type:complete len:1086 (+),score=339.49 TRINITY_DN20460_c0_g1_i1:145-3402(+)